MMQPEVGSWRNEVSADGKANPFNIIDPEMPKRMPKRMPMRTSMKIDLHNYRPKDLNLNGYSAYQRKKFNGDGLARIIQQAWETGAEKLCLVHGHGRSRGKSPGFVNTKTGRFGIAVRRQLRNNVLFRQWIKHSTLDCRDWGATTVKLKANPAPSRSALDWSTLPAPSFPDRSAAPSASHSGARAERVNPESSSEGGACIWIPGSRASPAPRNDHGERS